MKRFLCLLAALALTGARAGDVANLEFWGFSPDARFLAFEQYGAQDGSGFPFSRLAVVDVARNAFTASAETVIQNGDQDTPLEVARQPSRAKLRNALARAGVQRGLTGTLVFEKGPVLEREVDFSRPFGPTDLPKQASFQTGGKRYTLEVVQRAVPTACPDQGSPPQTQAQALELRLKVGNQRRVLQRDAKLPTSRNCVYDYGLARIYVYRSSVAVFLRVLDPGFEGPDVGWMVVTGKL